MTTGEAVRDDRWFLLAVLAGGLALRFLWFGQVYGDPRAFVGGGEAARVAFSIARGAGFADAYFAGSGPSAHVLPAMPLVAGGLLRLFGSGSGAANLALLGWSLGLALTGYLLAYRLFAMLGLDRASLRWGWVIVNLLPLYVHQEMVDFRFWDGALGLVLALANLSLIVAWRDRAALTPGAMAGAGLLAAATLFASPAAGLGAGACWAIFALRRLAVGDAIRFAGIAALALAAVLGPWAARNAEVLGEPIALRSNFGLEFALGNHDRAADPHGDPAGAYATRMLAIHPFFVPARPAFRAAGGEIAYSRALARLTWDWAADHPGRFALLSARHLSEFFAPRPWQMYFTGWEAWRVERSVALSTIGLAGLAWLAVGAWRRRPGFAMLLTYAVVAALPYALVQPVPRYAFIVWPLLAFLAADAIRGISTAAWGPRTPR